MAREHRHDMPPFRASPTFAYCSLDASALLSLLQREAGSERVLQALPAAVIGTANLAEAVSKLCERGLTAKEVEDVL